MEWMIDIWRESMKLSLRQREIIWNLFPMPLKKLRYNELKGKMSDLAEDDNFVFDRGIFRLFGGGIHNLDKIFLSIKC